MKFKDYVEIVEPLELPYEGKSYRIPPVAADDGIRFALAADGKEGFEPISDDETFTMFLGEAHAEMLADRVPQAFIQRCLDTAMADHLAGRLVAQIMWETGGDPKAVKKYVTQNAPNRATRRSQSTGAATSTKRAASSSGTKSRRK